MTEILIAIGLVAVTAAVTSIIMRRRIAALANQPQRLRGRLRVRGVALLVGFGITHRHTAGSPRNIRNTRKDR